MICFDFILSALLPADSSLLITLYQIGLGFHSLDSNTQTYSFSYFLFR